MEKAGDEVGLGEVNSEADEFGKQGGGLVLAKWGAYVVGEAHEDRGERFEGGNLRDPQEAVFGPNEGVLGGGLVKRK